MIRIPIVVAEKMAENSALAEYMAESSCRTRLGRRYRIYNQTGSINPLDGVLYYHNEHNLVTRINSFESKTGVHGVQLPIFSLIFFFPTAYYLPYRSAI